MVKDEADVIEGAIRHMSDEGVAGIIVADNGSTDGTRELLEKLDLPCELLLVDDPEIAYYQSRKMTRLAEQAAERGAEWIIPFDADELWTASDRLGVFLDQQPADVHVVRAALTHHFCTAVDCDDPDPFRAMEWRQARPADLPKVAFRYCPGVVIQPGNHAVMIGSHWQPGGQTGLAIRHFPYRSESQFISKARNGAAAYAETVLPEGIGAHWRQYGLILERQGEEGLREVFRQHFYYLAPVESGMIRDPAPYLRWQALKGGTP